MSTPIDPPGPDHRADPAHEISPKVNAAAVGSLLAGVALAVLTALLTPEGAAILGGLPGWASFLVLAAVPAVVSWLTGYAVRDPLRRG